MDREKSIYEEAMEKSDVKQDKYLTSDSVDSHFCEGCQHQFKELKEKEKECANCICTTLMNIS